jgi:1-acyl-sn-glycerol-3-phosphate acyltransferase
MSNAPSSSTVDARNSNPSLLLTCKTFLHWNGLYYFTVAFNLCLLFNVAQTRIYLILFYALLRVLSPGSWGCQHDDGCVWRTFSERLCFPCTTMRQYLKLSFTERPLPKEFVKEEAAAGAQFIFATFPHGCGCEYRIAMDGIIQQVMPNIIAKNNLRVLAASVLFYIPIIREMSLWTGCISASRKTAERALENKRSLLILIGGEAEQIMTTHGEEKVYLSKRKGFIKLAMRKGVAVVPLYVFGCNDYFYTSKMFYSLRYKLMRNLGICIPLCAGLWGSSSCPLPKKTTIVFGKPLRFKMEGSEPTTEELDAAHTLFTKELISLFDDHKVPLGFGDRMLKVM